MACATNSLPVPLSPWMRTVASVGATRAIASKTRRIGSLVFDNAVVSYNGDAVIHFNHPTWRTDRNDPATATRIDGRKVK